MRLIFGSIPYWLKTSIVLSLRSCCSFNYVMARRSPLLFGTPSTSTSSGSLCALRSFVYEDYSFPELPGLPVSAKNTTTTMQDSFKDVMMKDIDHKVFDVPPDAQINSTTTRRDRQFQPSLMTRRDQQFEAMCDRAKALGVQSCSEQTVKSITATLLCGLSALPDAAAMHQVVTDVKLSMSSMTPQAGLPLVLKFPANPLDLPQEVLSAAYGQSNPACKILDKYTVVLKQVPLRVTHASLSKNKQSGEATPAATPAQASSTSSSTGFTGVPDMQHPMQQMMCNMMTMGMQQMMCNKKALRQLLDIKTPEKQQEATSDQTSQQVNTKPAVPALMDETVTPATNVPAAAVATLQPKLRTQTNKF